MVAGLTDEGLMQVKGNARDMKQPDCALEAVWMGPYAWPGVEKESHLPSVPKQPGLYLFTFEYRQGYLIYAAGITRRTVRQRLSEHNRKYLAGDYTVLDVDALQEGVRSEIWHGGSWSPGWSPEKRADFEERKEIILGALRKQMVTLRIFVTDVGTEPRILERFEAAIMDHLYQQPEPLYDVPDKGMRITPRRDFESSIVISNKSTSLLHGLPGSMEI